ncbi:Major facilitator transporter [Pseudomonas aeruginosa]|nr:Major facilitator transporter [Pseudomonas aeruginosa]
MLMVYPLFAWVAAAPSLGRLLLMQLLLCTAIGGFFGPAPTAVAEQFSGAGAFHRPGGGV